MQKKLRNSYVKIDRKDAIKLEEGQYFIADLLGLDVFLDTGEKLGILDDIFNNGSTDIYVVKNELGKQFLLPYIDEVIKNIDLENEKNNSTYNRWINLKLNGGENEI